MTRKLKKRKGRRGLDWMPASMMQMVRTRPDGRLLAVIIGGDPGRWVVAAIETTEEAGRGGLAGVFGAHAHEALGTFQKIGQAMRAGERYAAKWEKTKAVADPCGCEEIEK